MKDNTNEFEQLGVDFQDQFGVALCEFWDFRSSFFAAWRFKKRFYLDHDGISLREMVAHKWGEDAAELIERCDSFQFHANNEHLSRANNGKQSTYYIMQFGDDNRFHGVEAKGVIFYPFAARRVDNRVWSIDHLPTGASVWKETSRKQGANCAEHLANAVQDGCFDEVNYTQDAYNQLSAAMREWRESIGELLPVPEHLE